MRRTGALLAGLLLVFCSGCEDAEKRTTACPLPAAFSANVHVTQGTLQVEAAFTLSESGAVTFSLTAPEALRSLSLTLDSGGVRFSFLGIALETPPALLPDAAFAKCLYEAFAVLRSGADCAQTPYGDGTAYTCKTAAGDIFTLALDADGAPQTLIMESRDLQADFTDFSAA